MRSTVAAPLTAARARRHRSLDQQLEAMRREQGHYRRHYTELEAVCWDLLNNLASTETDGGGAHESRGMGRSPAVNSAATPSSPCTSPSLIPPAAAAHARSGERGLGCPPSLSCVGSHPSLSPSTEATTARVSTQRACQSHPSDPLPLFQGNAVSWADSQRRTPRPCKAEVLSPQETQLLLSRLRKLHQWMSDLVTGVSAATSSARADVGCSVSGALSDPSAAVTKAATDVCLRGDSSASFLSSPRSTGESPQRCVTALRLHRAVDDLFMLFTQLQATLTDTVWCIGHPPALSTPARTHHDRDVEVERLQAINQQLRRVLRGYEQPHRAAKGAPKWQAHNGVKASRGSTVPLPSSPPPGYTASNEPGLFIALRRR
ncbi:hypothetical protein GH5_06542 [Leishmania sp. Ghana 2012 LV757]|uniref:hypothetical protein n=1 Tax=Leishmania sp. Ghana 2012 LV757 TaxID=2803181 RepID=UPI001B642455|nr:hypothetical protein GH5_06542 [Leishmania sp. Ghana 2012 LV757]